MRTLTLVCTFVVLTSCVDKKANQKPPAAVRPAQAQVRAPAQQPVPRPEDRDPIHIFGTDESSPIIISDGSIKVEHHLRGSHFRVHAKDHAVLKLANFEVNQLGFGCDPTLPSGASSCTAVGTCAASNTATACKLVISPKASPGYSWKLDLCDTVNPCTSAAAAVTLLWDSKGRPDFERIDIQTIGNFTLDGNGVPIVKYVRDPAHPNSSHLLSAHLTVTDAMGMPTLYDFDLTGPYTALELSYDCSGSGNTCRPDHQ
uniref:Lipoprotein n=1 Tax=Solibacter usitatus (strain Ellin6076) TaxID=234267 RepID=Q01QI8_SOLUE